MNDNTIAVELRSSRDHFAGVVAQMNELPDAPLPAQFCERIEALLDEFAWERGEDRY